MTFTFRTAGEIRFGRGAAAEAAPWAAARGRRVCVVGGASAGRSDGLAAALEALGCEVVRLSVPREPDVALVEDGVDISRALFPLGDGQVSFDPFVWIYGAEENRITLRVSGVQVGDFLGGIGDGRLKITGALEGTIPVVVRGIDVLVDKGRLEVINGGLIQFEAKDVSDAIPNEMGAQAIEALQNFNYQNLFLEINGPLDGEIKVGLAFTGSNPDVFYAIPFQFDITVEGELFNIARSLNPNGLQQRVLSSVKNKSDDK